MTPEHYQQIGQLYHAALERAAHERTAFLAQACADEELQSQVETLLAAHAQAGDFLTPVELPPRYIGQQIAQYRVHSLLGKGGMGEVYLAQDTRLGRQLALELLPAAFTRDAEHVRRFQQEARAASALNHPNIVTIFDIGQNLSAEQWYSGLLTQMAQQLELDDELEESWDAQPKLGPLQRWMQALQQLVLPRYADRRVVVFVDEIDAVRSLPFSTDEFFAAIRACYNRRTADAAFQRLTFFLKQLP